MGLVKIDDLIIEGGSMMGFGDRGGLFKGVG